MNNDDTPDTAARIPDSHTIRGLRFLVRKQADALEKSEAARATLEAVIAEARAVKVNTGKPWAAVHDLVEILARAGDPVVLPKRGAKPVQIDREALVEVLSTSLWERGNRVNDWPEDEAEAYRELGWAEGAAAARSIVMGKAADAVIAHLLGQGQEADRG